MKYRQTSPIEVAAAKASISRATAYRIEKDARLPSKSKPPRDRRRPDPLEHIFDTDVVPLLKSAPGIRAVAVSTKCCGVIRNCPKVYAARLSVVSDHGGLFTVRSRR